VTAVVCVVDENVLIVANGRETHASADCISAAVGFLLECSKERALLLDEGYLILGTYAGHCSHSGAPGVGDQFFVWARDNAATLRKIRLETDDDRAYVAFPKDPDLKSFDWDDRIFVAAACASSETCDIANAIDSDYRDHAAALARHVSVRELCPDDLRSASPSERRR
jgi:hypothetical protein